MQEHDSKSKGETHVSDLLWDAFCLVTAVGIWPRFVEPAIIATKKLSLPIHHLPEDLEHFKILQFSDLHLHPRVSNFFLDKLVRKAKKLRPDLIVFTGDFLFHSKLFDKERLIKLLNRFSAPYGCYAILGNHDYQHQISVNDNGDYDIVNHHSSFIGIGFKRLFSTIRLSKIVTPRARSVKHHSTLIDTIQKSPFQLLDNKSTLIPVKNSHLNVCGVGEHMLDRCQPEIAFKNYDPRFPGIVLAHNPDCIPILSKYPGQVILCGHTHGGQVNLPWIWKKCTLMENPHYKKGLFKLGDKWIYVNRGIGSTLSFRWFAPPELLLLTLKKASS